MKKCILVWQGEPQKRCYNRQTDFCSNMSFSYCPDCYNSDYRYLKGRQKKGAGQGTTECS